MSFEEIVVYVADQLDEDTYNADAIHPLGHLVVLNGQGHCPTPCDCQGDQP